MKTVQNKSKGKKAGVPIKGGAGGMLRGIQRTGPQAPGVTGVTKGASNKKFGADAGSRGGMFGRQSATPATPGQTGKGGGGGSSGGGRKKRGYGGDANGNPY